MASITYAPHIRTAVLEARRSQFVSGALVFLSADGRPLASFALDVTAGVVNGDVWTLGFAFNDVTGIDAGDIASAVLYDTQGRPGSAPLTVGLASTIPRPAVILDDLRIEPGQAVRLNSATIVAESVEPPDDTGAPTLTAPTLDVNGVVTVGGANVPCLFVNPTTRARREVILSDGQNAYAIAVDMGFIESGAPLAIELDAPESVARVVIEQNPPLKRMGLSLSQVTERAPPGTVVGIFDPEPGATVTLTDSAGGRFARDGLSLVVGPTPIIYDPNSSPVIKAAQILEGRPNSPREDTYTITVIDVAEGPAISATQAPQLKAINDTQPLDSAIVSLGQYTSRDWAITGTPTYVFLVNGTEPDDQSVAPPGAKVTMAVTVRDTGGNAQTFTSNEITVDVGKPAWDDQPTIVNASARVGDAIRIRGGTTTRPTLDTIRLTTLKIGGVSRLAEASRVTWNQTSANEADITWDSAGETAGEITIQFTASNASGLTTLSSVIALTLDAAGAVDTRAPVTGALSYDEPTNVLARDADEGGVNYYIVNKVTTAQNGLAIRDAVLNPANATMQTVVGNPLVRASFPVALGTVDHTPDFSALTKNEEYVLHSVIVDAAGNASIDVPVTFTFNGDDLQIISSTPGKGAMNVPYPLTEYRITFDEKPYRNRKVNAYFGFFVKDPAPATTFTELDTFYSGVDQRWGSGPGQCEIIGNDLIFHLAEQPNVPGGEYLATWTTGFVVDRAGNPLMKNSGADNRPFFLAESSVIPDQPTPTTVRRASILGQSEYAISMMLNSTTYIQQPYPPLPAGGVDVQFALRATSDKSNVATIRKVDAAAIAAKDVNPGLVAFAALWHRGSGGTPYRGFDNTQAGTGFSAMMDDADPDRFYEEDAAVISLGTAAWGAPDHATYVWGANEFTVSKRLWDNRSRELFGLNPDGTDYSFTGTGPDHCLVDARVTKTGGNKGMLPGTAKIHFMLPGIKIQTLSETYNPPYISYLRTATGVEVEGAVYTQAIPAIEQRKFARSKSPAANRGAVTITPAVVRYGDWEGGVQKPAGQSAIHPAVQEPDGQILNSQHMAVSELIAAGFLRGAWVDRVEWAADGSKATVVYDIPPGSTLTTTRKFRVGRGQEQAVAAAALRPHQQLDGMGFTLARTGDLNTSTDPFGIRALQMRNARPLYRTNLSDATLYPNAYRATVAITNTGADVGGGRREARIEITPTVPFAAGEVLYFGADGGYGGFILSGVPDYDARLYKDALIVHIPALHDGTNFGYAGIPVEPQFQATVNLSATDTTAPTLASSSPADNATGVSPGSNIVLTFNEVVQFGTTGTITLRQNIGGTWSDAEVFDLATDIGTGDGTMSVSGNSVTLNPANPLVAGREYAIRVASTAIRNQAGLFFAGITTDTVVSFTVAAAAANTFTTVAAGPRFSDPTNLAAGTTRLEFSARLSVPALPTGSQVWKLFMGESLSCDLNMTPAGWNAVVKDSTAATVFPYAVVSDAKPAAGAMFDIDFDANFASQLVTVLFNGAVVASVPFASAGTGSFPSIRKFGYLGTTAGGNMFPAGTVIERLDMFATVGGVRARRPNALVVGPASEANAHPWKKPTDGTGLAI